MPLKLGCTQSELINFVNGLDDKIDDISNEYKMDSLNILKVNSSWTTVDITYSDGSIHTYVGVKLNPKYIGVVFVMSLDTYNQLLFHCIREDDALVVLLGSTQNVLIQAIYKANSEV